MQLPAHELEAEILSTSIEVMVSQGGKINLSNHNFVRNRLQDKASWYDTFVFPGFRQLLFRFGFGPKRKAKITF